MMRRGCGEDVTRAGGTARLCELTCECVCDMREWVPLRDDDQDRVCHAISGACPLHTRCSQCPRCQREEREGEGQGEEGQGTTLPIPDPVHVPPLIGSL